MCVQHMISHFTRACQWVNERRSDRIVTHDSRVCIIRFLARFRIIHRAMGNLLLR